jgi:DNA replication protein DnaD
MGVETLKRVHRRDAETLRKTKKKQQQTPESAEEAENAEDF